jgi:hypothetical protein
MSACIARALPPLAALVIPVDWMRAYHGPDEVIENLPRGAQAWSELASGAEPARTATANV